jgi:DNA polymerase elongation subunit (family B)
MDDLATLQEQSHAAASAAVAEQPHEMVPDDLVARELCRAGIMTRARVSPAAADALQDGELAAPLLLKMQGIQVTDKPAMPMRVMHPMRALYAMDMRRSSSAFDAELAAYRKEAARVLESSPGLLNATAKGHWQRKPLAVPPESYEELETMQDDDGEEDAGTRDGSLPLAEPEAPGTAPAPAAPKKQRSPKVSRVFLHGTTQEGTTVTVAVTGYWPWFELCMPDWATDAHGGMLAAEFSTMLMDRYPDAAVRTAMQAPKTRYHGCDIVRGALTRKKFKYLKVSVNSVAARRFLLQRLKNMKTLRLPGTEIPVDLASQHDELGAQFRADYGLTASKWFAVTAGHLQVCPWARLQRWQPFEGPAAAEKAFASQASVACTTEALQPAPGINAMGMDKESCLDIENMPIDRLFPRLLTGAYTSALALAAQCPGLTPPGQKHHTQVRFILNIGVCEPLPSDTHPNTVILCFKDARDQMEALSIIQTHVLDIDMITGWNNYGHDFPFLLQEYEAAFRAPYLRMAEGTVQLLHRLVAEVYAELDPAGYAALSYRDGIPAVPGSLYRLVQLVNESPLTAARLLAQLPEHVIEEIMPQLGAALGTSQLRLLYAACLNPNRRMDDDAAGGYESFKERRKHKMPYVQSIRSALAKKLKEKHNLKKPRDAPVVPRDAYLVDMPEAIARPLREAIERHMGIVNAEAQLELPDVLTRLPRHIADAVWFAFKAHAAQAYINALGEEERRVYLEDLPDEMDGADPSRAASPGSASADHSQSHFATHVQASQRIRLGSFLGSMFMEASSTTATAATAASGTEQYLGGLRSTPPAASEEALNSTAGSNGGGGGGLTNQYIVRLRQKKLATRTLLAYYKSTFQSQHAGLLQETWFTERHTRGLQRLLLPNAPMYWPEVNPQEAGPLALLAGRILLHPSFLEVKYMVTDAKGDNRYMMWTMNGRVKHDLMQIVKDEKKPPDNSLKYALKAYCPGLAEKVDLPYATMFDLTERGRPEDLAVVANYVDRDATGPLDIMNALKLSFILMERARTANTSLEDICNGGQQVRIISLLRNHMTAKAIALNTGGSKWTRNGVDTGSLLEYKESSEMEAYEGAIVVQPKPGYYTEFIDTSPQALEEYAPFVQAFGETELREKAISELLPQDSSMLEDALALLAQAEDPVEGPVAAAQHAAQRKRKERDFDAINNEGSESEDALPVVSGTARASSPLRRSPAFRGAAESLAFASRRKQRRVGNKIRGVIKSETIMCLDFASLYPSIIMAFGLCPSTLLNEEDAKHVLHEAATRPRDYDWSQGGRVDTSAFRDFKYVNGKGWRVCRGRNGGTRPFVEQLSLKINVSTHVAADGSIQYREETLPIYWAHYLQNVTEDMLKNILAQRKQAKIDMAKAFKIGELIEGAIQNGRQLGLKVIANSLYGFYGADTNPFSCKELAASVTYFGRNIILQTQDAVQRIWRGAAVTVYGDTDSVMVNCARIPLRAVADKFSAMLKEQGRPEAAPGEHAPDAIYERLKAWIAGCADGFEASMLMAWIAGMATEHFINEEFQNCGLETICLELEKGYGPYLLLKKKNYSGKKVEEIRVFDEETGLLLAQPGIPKAVRDQKGIAAVRRDKTAIVRETSGRILDALLFDRDVGKAFRILLEALHRFQDASGEALPVKDLMTTKSTRASYDISRPLPPPALVRARKQARQEFNVPPTGARVGYLILSMPADAFDSAVARYGEKCKTLKPWPGLWEPPSVKYARNKDEAKAAKATIALCAEDPEYAAKYGLPVDRLYYLGTMEKAIKKLLQPIPERLPFLDAAFDLTETIIREQQRGIEGSFAQRLTAEHGFTEAVLQKWVTRHVARAPKDRDFHRRIYFDKSGKELSAEQGYARNMEQLLKRLKALDISCAVWGQSGKMGSRHITGAGGAGGGTAAAVAAKASTSARKRRRMPTVRVM